MATLGELAHLIRSKNAGAFTLTFDVMFDTEEVYRRVLAANVLTKQSFAALYKVEEEDVLFFAHDAARARVGLFHRDRLVAAHLARNGHLLDHRRAGDDAADFLGLHGSDGCQAKEGDDDGLAHGNLAFFADCRNFRQPLRRAGC